MIEKWREGTDQTGHGGASDGALVQALAQRHRGELHVGPRTKDGELRLQLRRARRRSLQEAQHREAVLGGQQIVPAIYFGELRRIYFGEL